MAFALDELDQQIIGELRRNGRQANTEMARRLGVSETTIRNRIQRLISDGIIEVVARVNLSRLGYELSVIVGAHCQPGCAGEVVSTVSAMPEVRYVSYVTGRYDLLVGATFRSAEEVFSFLTERLARVAGLQRTETLHVLRVAKRDFDFGATLETIG